jgi:hypothetical protein
MEAQRAVVMVACRVALVRLMDPAAIDDHHDLLAGCAAGRHPCMERWAQRLGSTVRHDGRDDCGGTLLDRPKDTEEPAAGDPAPGARASPCLAFEGGVAFALTLAQRTRGV